LEPKRTGCDGRSQRRQRRPFFQDDGPKPGALSEIGRCAADDAATNDDEVGGLGR
jgi:hypothetical protein